MAIDNFGHGYSSFGLFKELAFSEIKIDRAFVHGCADSKANANVCKTMIELAHNFGGKASAVGIETSEEAQKLVELGCDIGQGYLFAKALTEQELMDMVMTARTESKGAVQPPDKDAGVAKPPG